MKDLNANQLKSVVGGADLISTIPVAEGIEFISINLGKCNDLHDLYEYENSGKEDAEQYLKNSKAGSWAMFWVADPNVSTIESGRAYYALYDTAKYKKENISEEKLWLAYKNKK